MDLEKLLWPFLLTLFAGLATGIGSTIAFFAKRTNKAFLSTSLGFSAGVMLYISFMEIIPTAGDSLMEVAGDERGWLLTVIAFFGGIALIAIIDHLIPDAENPHEVKAVEDQEDSPEGKRRLMRMGLFTALAIGIHNFPEGLATFIAALNDLQIGVAIAIAVAIHNIPEGIAISVPVYYATGSRKKAFLLSFLSGLAEPVGAVVGYLILLPFMSETTFGILFASVAGIMVFISLDELLPAAKRYGKHHHAIYGLIAGMAVMAVSLLLLD